VNLSQILKKTNRGFAILEIVVGAVVILGIGALVWKMMMPAESRNNSDTTSSPTPQTYANPTSTPTGAEEGKWPMPTDVVWENTSEGGWAPIYGTPPACPDPLEFVPPSDISKATSILYPGQERRGTFEGQGGNYKPHGGFRFDGQAYNAVQVKSPFDGYLYRGARFLMEGEIQYTFDIINPCGIMVRLGHLRELSPKFQEIADKFPEARELDSRTEKVTPMVKVETGEVIATAVGFVKENTFFDWGVFDLRRMNDSARSPAYQQAHLDAKELTFYAVCWFDLLSAEDEEFVRGLPAADPINGKNSDYCK
jgi:hypothetical protein